MKKSFIFLAVITSVLIFSSCAKFPQVEVDGAKTALEQSKAAQADVYLESEYLALNDSLESVTAQIEEQKSKFFGNYKDVKLKLAAITTMATDLVGKTEAKKEEVKADILQSQETVAGLMEENSKMLEMAPKGKEGKAAIEAIKGDLDAINAASAEIQGLLESGDLLVAQTKVNAVKEKATAINTELKTVIEKYNRKTK